MNFINITNIFTRCLIQHPDRTITEVYNGFAAWLYKEHGVSEIDHVEELLKIAVAIRKLPKEEQEKLHPALSVEEI